MDFSPGGRFVAILDDATRNLWVQDTFSGRAIKEQYSSQESLCLAVLVWSTNENSFYVADGPRLSRMTIQGEGTDCPELVVEPLEQARCPGDVAERYARLGQIRDRDREDWDWRPEMYSREEDRWLTVMWGLTSFIRASSHGASLTVSDNPGVFHLGRRAFKQGAFGADPAEVVFGDGRHIYLASIPLQKVGLITAGKRFVMPTRAFSKSEYLRYWLGDRK